LRITAFIGGLLGLALLVILVIHTDLAAMAQILELAGWTLFWLVPYRMVYFVLYAIGWRTLLRPHDSAGHAGLGYLLWVTIVREAIDRLLPVATIGGGVVGIRLLRWRGLALAPVSASVIVEILLTLIVLYLFTAVGLLLLVDLSATGREFQHLLLAFLCSLPVPAAVVILLRYGSVFKRLQGILRPIVGETATSEGAAALDAELRASLDRWRTLVAVAGMQFLAWLSGAFEIWFVLRLCGHPVDARVAIVLESMTQALRHLAFFVPAGLGVQEAGLVLFGRALGVSDELALAVSMAKRARELLCGLPALMSWQWMEARRLHRLMKNPS
jgi:putative membrane protein